MDDKTLHQIDALLDVTYRLGEKIGRNMLSDDREDNEYLDGYLNGLEDAQEIVKDETVERATDGDRP